MLRVWSNYRPVATMTGFEPVTSAVTGRHSSQLNYIAILVEATRIELVLLAYQARFLTVERSLSIPVYFFNLVPRLQE